MVNIRRCKKKASKDEKETPERSLKTNYSSPAVDKWGRTIGTNEGSGTLGFEDKGDQGVSGKLEEDNPRIKPDRLAKKNLLK